MSTMPGKLESRLVGFMASGPKRHLCSETSRALGKASSPATYGSFQMLG